jgi:hypothetical protein
MPSSSVYRLPLVANDAQARPEHLKALAEARIRATPAVFALLQALRDGTPVDLDRAIPPAVRELDLLWQAVGRVTQP